MAVILLDNLADAFLSTSLEYVDAGHPKAARVAETLGLLFDGCRRWLQTGRFCFDEALNEV